MESCFFSFFDYCFLGLFEFSEKNYVDWVILVVELFCCGYLIYHLYRSKLKDREALFVLVFQMMLYPLCDLRHFIPSFVPFLYYFLKVGSNKYIKVGICMLECVYLITAFVLYFIPFDIHTEKDLLYLKSPSHVTSFLDCIYEYFDGDVDNVYFASEHSYLFKLYYDIPITYFDFYLDDNLGYYSQKKIQKELVSHCEKNHCYFLVFKEARADSQNVTFVDFIKKHYQKVDKFDNMDIYSSK